MREAAAGHGARRLVAGREWNRHVVRSKQTDLDVDWRARAVGLHVQRQVRRFMGGRNDDENGAVEEAAEDIVREEGERDAGRLAYGV